MTTYVAIPNGDIDQDSPGTQPLFTALRDNPIAITEGAAGAPRNTDASLSTTATTTGRDWISNRLALFGGQNVGSCAFAATNNSTTTVAFGATTAGSTLQPAGFVESNLNVSGSALSGTWLCLGYKPPRVVNNAAFHEATLFMRIA